MRLVQVAGIAAASMAIAHAATAQATPSLVQ